MGNGENDTARLFEPQGTAIGARGRRINARYDIAYTLVDLFAALAFVAGSICFFWDSLDFAGTWLFLFGSILFAVKPTLRLSKEVALARLWHHEKVQERP